MDLYDIDYIPTDNSSGSTIGIAGFLEQYPNQRAVYDFLSAQSPRRHTPGYSPNYNFMTESIAGGNATSDGWGWEAVLDTEFAMVFTQPLPVTYYSTGGRGPYLGVDGSPVVGMGNRNEPWIDFLEHLLAKPDGKLDLVLSISYADTEQSIQPRYARRVCDLFMQLAARGVSVLIATGDGGAAAVVGHVCVTNDGTRRPRFHAPFPASCPYVTAVGATANILPLEGLPISGGGFSEYFVRPAWQDAAVRGYLAQLREGEHRGLYNYSGRGVPDLSLVGQRYRTGSNAHWQLISGTSAGTPVVAAMIALVNDKRLRQGQPPLGFLNPILYSKGLQEVFTDAKIGVGDGCSEPGKPDYEPGWRAVEGWDPLTGLGTPYFPALFNATTYKDNANTSYSNPAEV